MNRTEIILIILFLIVQIELLIIRYKPLYFKLKKNKKEEVIQNLVNKQKEDSFILEKDKDLVLLDTYMEFIKQFLDNYNKSRSKRISLKTRQTLLIKTIDIIPIASQYIKLNYYYNLEDKEWYKLTDKDMILLLETSYNDYTHDNLDSLNSVFTAVLRLRDDRR